MIELLKLHAIILDAAGLLFAATSCVLRLTAALSKDPERRKACLAVLKLTSRKQPSA